MDKKDKPLDRAKHAARNVVMGKSTDMESIQMRLTRAGFGLLYCLLVYVIIMYIIKPWIDDKTPDAHLRNNIMSWGVSGGLGVLLVIGCFFSLRLTCMLAMSIPTLATLRGRLLLFMICINLLISGPTMNIFNNFDKITEATGCYLGNMPQHPAEISFVQNGTDLLQELKEYTILRERRLNHGLNAALEIAQEIRNNTVQGFNEAEEALYDELRRLRNDTDYWRTPPIIHGFMTLIGELLQAGSHMKEVVAAEDDEETQVELAGFTSSAIQFVTTIGKFCSVVEFVEWVFPIMANKDELMMIFSKSKAVMLNFFNVVNMTIFVVQKLLYVTLLLMFMGAYNFICNYLSDDSFDNNRVDYNFTRAWTEGNDYKIEGINTVEKNEEIEDKRTIVKILPLRRWEKTTFHYRWKGGFRFEEIKTMVLGILPISFFSIALILIFAVDELLYDTAITAEHIVETTMSKDVILMLDEAVSFNMSLCDEQGMELVQKIIGKLEKEVFENCTLKLEPPHISMYLPLVLMLCVTLLSVFLQAYSIRLRPLICAFFYPTRALERAIFLHTRITAGRKRRGELLPNIARRLLAERGRTKTYRIGFCPVSTEVCLLCSKKYGKHGEVDVTLAPDLKNITICGNCNIEFENSKKSEAENDIKEVESSSM